MSPRADPLRPRRPSLPPGRFAALFACLFLFGIGLLLTPPVQRVDVRFSHALVSVSQQLITIFGGKASVEHAVLREPVTDFAIEMKDGCNGVNVMILLWAAVLAFPAAWKLKAFGITAGALVIQAVNIARFISLFYIGQYSLKWFDFAHNYLWETLLILDTMVVFWVWVNRVTKRGAVSNAGI
jgi:exosortase H (IPTLxxWG-CTERM-specific)